jgi:hypothetical protein
MSWDWFMLWDGYIFKEIIIYLLFIVLGGGTLWHLQRFIKCIKYILLESTPSTALPYSITPSPDSWNSFNRYHFCIYIRVYTLFPLYSSSYPFPWHFPHSPSCPLGRICSVYSALLFSNCVEEKTKDKMRNMTFLLVWNKDSYTRSFLVLFPWI